MNGEYNGDFNNIKEEKVCVKYNLDDEGHRSDFYKGWEGFFFLHMANSLNNTMCKSVEFALDISNIT